MEHVTERQHEVLLAIADGVGRGRPPSVRELGRELGISSTNGVAEHIDALKRKGLVERESAPNGARSDLRLTKRGRKTITR